MHPLEFASVVLNLMHPDQSPSTCNVISKSARRNSRQTKHLKLRHVEVGGNVRQGSATRCRPLLDNGIGPIINGGDTGTRVACTTTATALPTDKVTTGRTATNTAAASASANEDISRYQITTARVPSSHIAADTSSSTATVPASTRNATTTKSTKQLPGHAASPTAAAAREFHPFRVKNEASSATGVAIRCETGVNISATTQPTCDAIDTRAPAHTYCDILT